MPEGSGARPAGQRRGLDRVRAPDPREHRHGDVRGKRALYSVDPDANPTPALIVACPHCGVEQPLPPRRVAALFRPPFVANPVAGTVWTRCPTCRRRVWLRVRMGPGVPRLVRLSRRG